MIHSLLKSTRLPHFHLKCSIFPYVWSRSMTINTRYIKREKTEQFLKPGCGCTVVQNRPLMRFFKTFSEEEYKEIDTIPEPYSLIYHNTFDRNFLLLQAATTVSAAIIILFSCFDEKFWTLDFSQLTGSQAKIVVCLTAITLSYSLLQVILNQTPMRIYYFAPKRHYIFVFYGYYFSNTKQLNCKIGDIKQLYGSEIQLGKNSMYLMENKQYLSLFNNYFKRPEDLLIMLGKQKDPDVSEETEKINKDMNEKY